MKSPKYLYALNDASLGVDLFGKLIWSHGIPMYSVKDIHITQ